jgi:hypothetical protein
MSKKKTSEIRLLAPRRVPLRPAQRREAVALLAELPSSMIGSQDLAEPGEHASDR